MSPEMFKNQGERNKKPLIIDRNRKIIAFIKLHTFVFLSSKNVKNRTFNFVTFLKYLYLLQFVKLGTNSKNNK